MLTDDVNKEHLSNAVGASPKGITMKKALASLFLGAIVAGVSQAHAATVIEVPVTTTRMALHTRGLSNGNAMVLAIFPAAGGHLYISCQADWDAKLNVDLGSAHVTKAPFSAKVSGITKSLEECQSLVSQIHKNILSGDSKVRIEIELDEIVNIFTVR